jgi:hypothetical protein
MGSGAEFSAGAPSLGPALAPSFCGSWEGSGICGVFSGSNFSGRG